MILKIRQGLAPLLVLALLAACAPVVPVKDDRIPGARVADYRGGPTERNAALAGWSFVIDPGHGGAERGAPSAEKGYSAEADDNLAVGLLLGGMLEASGAQVAYTRQADIAAGPAGAPLKDELKSRSALANRLDPDFFISIHHNGSEKPEHDGIEVYYKLFTSGPAESLSGKIARELSRLYPDFDSRVMAGNFAVLRSCAGEAVLVECAYMSDRRLAPELEKLRLLKKEAAAIYEGIRAYAKQPDPFVTMTADSTGLDLLVRDHVPLREVVVIGQAEDGVGERVYHPDSTGFRLHLSPRSDGDTDLAVNARNREFGTAMYRRVPQPRLMDIPRVDIVLPDTSGIGRDESTADSSLWFFMLDPSADPSMTLYSIEYSPPDYTIVLLDAPGKVITHYYRSPTGEKLARALAKALPGYTVRSGSGYLLNHTSMPTVTITLPRLDEPTLERLKRALRDFVR